MLNHPRIPHKGIWSRGKGQPTQTCRDYGGTTIIVYDIYFILYYIILYYIMWAARGLLILGLSGPTRLSLAGMPRLLWAGPFATLECW